MTEQNTNLKVLCDDNRGKIVEVAKNCDVLNITSKAGSKRANHYHKTSSHLCRLLRGFMYYYERPVGSKALPVKIPIYPGDYFFTGPMVEHAMSFPDQDSEFDCFSFGDRDQKNYEDDLVRLDFDLEEEYEKLVTKNPSWREMI